MNNLYSVQNDSGQPIILTFGGAAAADGCPVFSQTGKPLKVALGDGSFYGNGSQAVGVTIAHGLGIAPSYVNVMPALVSPQLTPGNNAWSAVWGQTNAADSYAFYMMFNWPPGGNAFPAGYTFYFNWIAIAQLS